MGYLEDVQATRAKRTTPARERIMGAIMVQDESDGQHSPL
jgi:hypothetical protein